jgi:hypothetical protein
MGVAKVKYKQRPFRPTHKEKYPPLSSKLEAGDISLYATSKLALFVFYLRRARVMNFSLLIH